MILLLDTSTPICKLTLIDDDKRFDVSWEAGRELALGLLDYIEQQLKAQGKEFNDLSGLAVFRGPGSFTGLRIGITVLNTLADALDLPIVGESGEQWQEVALSRLLKGESDKIILPLYGSEAHITAPRK